MRTLEKVFLRKGIQYETIEKTEKAGFFKLSLDGECVGYEVCKIHTHDSYEVAGVTVESRESIVGDESFGADGSKAFFPHEKGRAYDYFKDFCKEIAEKDAKKAEITSL